MRTGISITLIKTDRHRLECQFASKRGSDAYVVGAGDREFCKEFRSALILQRGHKIV